MTRWTTINLRFQSTHPRGVRPRSLNTFPTPSKVSIHAPTRGATFNPFQCLQDWKSFNPRTHEGCDKVMALVHLEILVSIHAPTRGATGSRNVIYAHQGFQSTHPRGVRPQMVSCLGALLSFNPRTHEGCDTYGGTSLHQQSGFNPRTHEGCDATVFKYLLPIFMFQSTHPRGVRPHVPPLQVGSNRFQSTHPRGVRPGLSSSDSVNFQVSIHAPTRGATAQETMSDAALLFQSTHPRGVRLGSSSQNKTNKMFQSTHPRGVRRTEQMQFLKDLSVSIHAPTRGATQPYQHNHANRTFQSTHPRGVRPFTEKCCIKRINVSIHAPTRGATPDVEKAFVAYLFQSTHPRGVRLHILQNTEY